MCVLGVHILRWTVNGDIHSVTWNLNARIQNENVNRTRDVKTNFNEAKMGNGIEDKKKMWMLQNKQFFLSCACVFAYFLEFIQFCLESFWLLLKPMA